MWSCLGALVLAISFLEKGSHTGSLLCFKSSLQGLPWPCNLNLQLLVLSISPPLVNFSLQYLSPFNILSSPLIYFAYLSLHLKFRLQEYWLFLFLLYHNVTSCNSSFQRVAIINVEGIREITWLLDCHSIHCHWWEPLIDLVGRSVSIIAYLHCFEISSHTHPPKIFFFLNTKSCNLIIDNTREMILILWSCLQQWNTSYTSGRSSQ